jgi:signal transduction histidine kinase
MAFRFSPTIERVNEFVDWFIPAELAKDREKRKQARMFLFSHIFGPFIGNVVPAALFVFDHNPTFDVYVLAASITAFWLFPFALRWFGRYETLVLLSVQNLIFCILWSCYYYGGVTSPTLSWVVTIPLLAFFYIGPHSRLRNAVLALFAVNSIGFTLIYAYGPTIDKHLPAASSEGLGLVSTACAAIYVMMMAIYYAKTVASSVELEAEMRRHLTTFAELRRATIEAERAGAAKAEFLAKMSHELRTPLNAILGYSKLMLETAMDNGNRGPVEDLGKIFSAGRHLLKLINEILDLSKIEAGKMDLFNEEISLPALIGQIARDWADEAAQGGNDIVVDVSRGPELVTCDLQKLEQIITQLLENAIKFTKEGRILITAESDPADPHGHVRISVQDSGIGIAPELLPSLFEKFSAAKDATSSKYGGTGLGLALGRQLCRLMGGDIVVSSAPGKGSCFTVKIPVRPLEECAAAPEALADGQILKRAA